MGALERMLDLADAAAGDSAKPDPIEEKRRHAVQAAEMYKMELAAQRAGTSTSGPERLAHLALAALTLWGEYALLAAIPEER